MSSKIEKNFLHGPLPLPPTFEHADFLNVVNYSAGNAVLTTLQDVVIKAGIYNWNDQRIDPLLTSTRMNVPEALMMQPIAINKIGQTPRRVRLRTLAHFNHSQVQEYCQTK